MSRYILIVIFFILVSAGRSAAQSDSLVYFLDRNLEPTAREQAINVAIGVKEGNLWKLDIYDNQSEQKVISGHYADSMLKISEGLFQYFNTAGGLIGTGSFVQGKKQGSWVEWNDSGNKKDSAFYEKDKWISRYEYREDGSLIREAHWNGKKLEQKEYRADGKLSIYQGFGDDGKLAFQGRYDENGELITEKPLSEKEIAARRKEYESKLPEYPGGQGAFQSWVDNLRIPSYIASEFSTGEEIRISFYLDELGKAYNITTSKSGEFTEFIKVQLARSQPWKMKGYKKWGPINFLIRV